MLTLSDSSPKRDLESNHSLISVDILKRKAVSVLVTKALQGRALSNVLICCGVLCYLLCEKPLAARPALKRLWGENR